MVSPRRSPESDVTVPTEPTEGSDGMLVTSGSAWRRRRIRVGRSHG